MFVFFFFSEIFSIIERTLKPGHSQMSAVCIFVQNLSRVTRKVMVSIFGRAIIGKIPHKKGERDIAVDQDPRGKRQSSGNFSRKTRNSQKIVHAKC